MPTITLTIDEALLGALVRGEAVHLQATLRQRKTRQPAALSPEQEALRRDVSDLLAAAGQSALIARLWPQIKAKLADEAPADVVLALETCLDWCDGPLASKAAFFVADYADWHDRARLSLMDAEPLRAQWRAQRGAA